MKISNDIVYIGVNDHKIDLFEGQYIVPDGMSYNSYIILDDKIAVLDTVDKNFDEEWLNNIKNVLGDKKPSYLIIQHMEPDHSANIVKFMELYKDTIIVSSSKAFQMMKNYFKNEFSERRLIVNEGDTLSLGKHTLHFVNAMMVHWPEVIMTYDDYDKVLFSADAFGKFGALDVEQEWDCEARRYYIGIVGKFGPQVQLVLKKARALDIKTICPLHGPILKDDLSHYLKQYDTWSSYKVETEGVLICYTSVYGNTKAAVELLAKYLKENNCPKVVVNDLARMDMAEAIEDAFRYGKIVLATTTYNNDIFPFMRDFISRLIEHNFQNKKIALIENGSWAPLANKVMKGLLEKSKNITFAEHDIKILASLSETNIQELKELAKELCK